MYVAALRTFARPCCFLGVLVQFCRRTYLDGETARTTRPTAPAFSPGVSTPVRPCPARSHLVSLRLVRSRPVRPNPHDAIAHVCFVRARAMRVGCVRLRPARWGVVFVQGFAYVHLVVALVPPAAVVNIALFDCIVRVCANIELFFATVCVDTLWIGDVTGLVIVAACYETVGVSRPTPDWFYPGGCVAPLPFCPPYCLVIKLALW